MGTKKRATKQSSRKNPPLALAPPTPPSPLLFVDLLLQANIAEATLAELHQASLQRGRACATQLFFAASLERILLQEAHGVGSTHDLGLKGGRLPLVLREALHAEWQSPLLKAGTGAKLASRTLSDPRSRYCSRLP